MGVWRDWVRSQRSEKTGAIKVSSIDVTSSGLSKHCDFTSHENS
jgi:hypothetical protein